LPNSWNPVHVIPQLQAHEVQLWRIDLEETADLIGPYSSFLSDEEQTKSKRYRIGRPRDHFAIGRACLRILLGNERRTDPSTIAITKGPHGKPEALGAGIAFNVAHSNDTILIALSRNGPLGVDVEYLDPATDIMEVSQANFTENESASLSAISNPDARLRTFYTYWTRKEAITKADGRGLLLPLNSFDIALDSMAHHPIDVGDNEKNRFFLSDLDVGSDAVGALAMQSPDCGITRLIFPLGSLPLVGLQ
jgi:4'-phosphopantetheinyl transferase